MQGHESPIKLAVISDIHGNSTALEVVLAELEGQGITEIINLGDAIAIGPDPERVLGLLVAKRIPSLCGNHEQYFLEGTKAFPEMEEGERLHQDWIREQLAEPFIPVVSEFPLQQIWFSHGRQVTFVHYAMTVDWMGRTRFLPPKTHQTLESMHALFGETPTERGITLFGHVHEPCHILDPISQHHFINPGSLGCHPENLARYAIVTISEEAVEVSFKTVAYNKTLVMERLFDREVPERESIVKNFYT